MSTENREQIPPMEGISEEASRIRWRSTPLLASGGRISSTAPAPCSRLSSTSRRVAAEQWLSFLDELGSIVAGKSERAPKAGDRRFSDATWKESALHGGMLKAYLAWGDAVSGFVDKTSLSDIDKSRAASGHGNPDRCSRATNAILTNPAAVRKFVETGGQSLWYGLKNYFDDLAKTAACRRWWIRAPSRSAKLWRPRRGVVVFRNELLELIQYSPTTPNVRKRPLVITPPQINKYYALDAVARQKHGALPARQRHSGILRQLAQSYSGAS